MNLQTSQNTSSKASDTGEPTLAHLSFDLSAHSKLTTEWRKRKGESLSLKEVSYLVIMCRVIQPAPGTRSKDIETFQDLSRKAT